MIVFEKIKKKTITGIDYQTYIELFYDANIEIKNFFRNTKADDTFAASIMKTHNCYNDALSIWEKGSPEALIQNGIVSLYQDAARRFDHETAPVLLKKRQECANYLEEAKNSIR